MDIYLIRHGPKSTLGKHVTGREAQLDPDSFDVIRQYARDKLHDLLKSRERIKAYGTNDLPDRIRIASTPMARAWQTQELMLEAIVKEAVREGIDINENIEIDTHLGANIGPIRNNNPEEDGKYNLFAPEASKLWGVAKRIAKKRSGVSDDKKEDAPMKAWCRKMKYDNPLGFGITLKEAGLRIGKGLYDRTEKYRNSGIFQKHILISHSSNIEPFVYLLLETADAENRYISWTKKNRPDYHSFIAMVTQSIERPRKSMLNRFKSTKGAIKPLEGISMEYYWMDDSQQFKFNLTESNQQYYFERGGAIFPLMAEIYGKTSQSEKILQHRMSEEKR